MKNGTVSATAPEAPTAYIELIAYDTRTQEARHIGTVTPEKLAAIEALLRQ